jgi:uncharacterized protein YigE (DUF2233 family)
MAFLSLSPIAIAVPAAIWAAKAMWCRRWYQAVGGAAVSLLCVTAACYVIIQQDNVLRRVNAMHPESETQRIVRDSTTRRDTSVLIQHLTVDKNTFTAVTVDLQHSDLRLFWKRTDGSRYGNFSALSADLREHGQQLVFAANAGIFAPDFSPCGLHVEAGTEQAPLNLQNGEGNFYMKPNGVFLVDDTGAHVIDARKYGGTNRATRLATQSGPLLVIDGGINPQFRPGSANRRLRSGIGVSSDQQQVHFVLSDQPVTFHELASLFRDRLGCLNAVYLDGVISRFYLPDDKAEPNTGNFAGILGVIVKP